MATKQLLESLDSGSNYNFGDKMDKANAPRSVFDLSHLNTLTIYNAGEVIPISIIETLPNDDFDINVDCLLRVMPQVVPMYSRQRLYIYAFYGRISDYWQNFNTFMTKGYSGNVIKQIPTLKKSKNFKFAEDATDFVKPDSFLDYIGLPQGATYANLFDDSNNASTAGISALIHMMSLRVYRDYFANKNHFINDRVLLPDDDSRFRLNDDGELLSAKDENVTFKFEDSKNGYLNDGNGNVSFGGIFYHDYPMDYFQSALPFTQRGDTPSISDVSPVKLSSQKFDYSSDSSESTKTFGSILSSLGIPYSADEYYAYQVSKTSSSVIPDILATTSDTVFSRPQESLGFKQTDTYRIAMSSLSITLNQIRELAVKQTELEKMAHTDGSYRDFGLTFFGEVSKNAQDFRPIYIGGTYKNIVFTEVLQTSGSSVGTTDPSSNSPLGAYAGHGITGITNGRIGHIHCDDFGFIMMFACIMPDVYYSQGIDKMFTRSLQSDFYLPERSKLGMIPILNKELYYAGNNGNDVGEDNYLWAYQNPFDEFRYIPNKIHGKIADPNNLSFFPYTQSRKFTQLPNWGESFALANDVRKDSFFATSSEDGYTAQFKFNIRAVRALPYKAIPAKII